MSNDQGHAGKGCAPSGPSKLRLYQHPLLGGCAGCEDHAVAQSQSRQTGQKAEFKRSARLAEGFPLQGKLLYKQGETFGHRQVAGLEILFASTTRRQKLGEEVPADFVEQ
ncbi:hypothetical protein LP417_35300 (plasmid) [Polaromonas sp. P1-6]|nr:hypothetical protein LP417_35300 [Polaromonas sp. P1-6]